MALKLRIQKQLKILLSHLNSCPYNQFWSKKSKKYSQKYNIEFNDSGRKKFVNLIQKRVNIIEYRFLFWILSSFL